MQAARTHASGEVETTADRLGHMEEGESPNCPSKLDADHLYCKPDVQKRMSRAVVAQGTLRIEDPKLSVTLTNVESVAVGLWELHLVKKAAT